MSIKIISNKKNMFNIFFFMLYKNFISIYNYFFNNKKTKILLEEKKDIPIQTSIFKLVNTYIEKEKERFLLTYKQDSKIFNVNMSEIFYNVKEYNKLLLDSNNELEEIWKKKILYETTPIGNIIMFYNVYKKGFSYYSDINLTYPLLNAVAMKYVRIFCCRDLFIDEKSTIEKDHSLLINLEEKEEKKEKDEKRNKEGKENKIDIVDNKIFKKGPFIKIKKNNVETNNKSIEKNKSWIEQNMCSVNRFINMGKTSNFSFIQKMEKKRIKFPNHNGFKSAYNELFDNEHNLQKEIFSYKDYKNLLKK